MAEYIEREALINAGEKITLEDITPNWDRPLVKPALIKQGQTLLKLIKKQPTADVVKVVRCKDCAVPHNKWTGCPKLNGLIPPPNHFCSYGERKESV